MPGVGTADLAKQQVEVSVRDVQPTVAAELPSLSPEGDFELGLISAEPTWRDGDLVLVVDDGRRRVHLAAEGPPLDAVRGALRLAAALAAHGRVLASRLERDNDVRVMVHLPERPAWLCWQCGGAWPCQMQRRQLLVKFADQGDVLLMLMTIRMAEATADLGVAELPGLHDRFVGWIPGANGAGQRWGGTVDGFGRR